MYRNIISLHRNTTASRRRTTVESVEILYIYYHVVRACVSYYCVGRYTIWAIGVYIALTITIHYCARDGVLLMASDDGVRWWFSACCRWIRWSCCRRPRCRNNRNAATTRRPMSHRRKGRPAHAAETVACRPVYRPIFFSAPANGNKPVKIILGITIIVYNNIYIYTYTIGYDVIKF